MSIVVVAGGGPKHNALCGRFVGGVFFYSEQSMTLNEAKRKRLIVPDWIGVFNVLGVVEIYGDQG